MDKYVPKIGDYIHPPNTNWVGKLVRIEAQNWHIHWVVVPVFPKHEQRINTTEIIDKKAHPLTKATEYEFEQNCDTIKSLLGVK